MLVLWNNKLFPRKNKWKLYKRIVGMKHHGHRPDEILFTISETHELLSNPNSEGYLKHLQGALKSHT